MANTLQSVVLEVEGGKAHFYYGFNNTSDSPTTPITRDRDTIIDPLLVGRDTPSEWREYFESIEPVVSISDSGLQDIQSGLVAFARGEDVSVETKQALLGLDTFMDHVLDARQLPASELTTDRVSSLIGAVGLGGELQEFAAEQGSDNTLDMRGLLSDRFDYPTYIHEALNVKHGDDTRNIEPFNELPARRRVVAGAFAMKAWHAVGALYDAGMQGNEPAAQLSTALEPLIRI